ncbi:RNA metabolism protein [Lithospermum erythrorhizon]|uniref:RNA metabolism protein n=1 Tax=Lithospermum erythrorhizon TaxID=34254 RepID=A0AAV3Q9E7_LITER
MEEPNLTANNNELNKEAPQLVNVLKEMKDGLDKVTSKIQVLTAKVKADRFPTKDGISYLEAKHLLLLNYCQSLVYYLLRKAKGLSIDGHPVVRSLVEIRMFLEKVRPIDKKLQYQIQKITRVTEIAEEPQKEKISDENGKSEDILKYRPNTDMLIPKTNLNPQDGVYRPPQFALVPMEQDKISKKDRNARRKDEDMLRRAKGNDYINSLINESVGRPEEVRETIGVETGEHKRYIEKLQQRAEQEEELFSRAPIPKSEKQNMKRLMKSRNGLSGLTESLFDDIKSMPLEFDAPEQSGGVGRDRAAKRRKAARERSCLYLVVAGPKRELGVKGLEVEGPGAACILCRRLFPR